MHQTIILSQKTPNPKHFPSWVSQTLCLDLNALYTFSKLCFHLLLSCVWFLSHMNPENPVGWSYRTHSGSWDPACQHQQHRTMNWESKKKGKCSLGRLLQLVGNAHRLVGLFSNLEKWQVFLYISWKTNFWFWSFLMWSSSLPSC